MAPSPAIWVVADAADARRFMAEPRPGARLLALTPVARAALLDADAERIDPRRHFTDWAQARTVVAVQRARAKLVAATASLPGARASQREIALEHFLRAAYTAYRIWFTLGASGPWMVPEDRAWRRCETRDEAYRTVLQHMLARLVAGHTQAARAQVPPLPGLYRALRGALLRACCRKRVAFVSGARKGMFGLLDAIAAQSAPARIVIVQSAGGGWRDYLRLARNAWRALRGERFVDVSLLAAPRGKALAAADRLVAAIDDGVIATALGFYRALLAYRLAQVAPALADAHAILAAAAPRHYISSDASRLSDWALAEACGEAGITRWVFSRNTHVKPTSRLAEDACHGYFLARHPEGLVDRYLFWTPHGAAAAREMLPRERHAAIEAVAAIPIAGAGAARSSSAPRRLLLADSYATWWFTHSWAFQTSDEFLAALTQLISVVEQIPNTQLLVRAKRKTELDVAEYDMLIPASERASIKIRDVPFTMDILDSDVLVAFRSSAIEEALHARRPTLLWGGSARYRYLPARTSPPTPADRGVVYAADDVRALAALLPAILDAHAGRPLTDRELAPHVWPAGTPDIGALARRMAEGRVLPRRDKAAAGAAAREVKV
jgi:hypothetical protein